MYYCKMASKNIQPVASLLSAKPDRNVGMPSSPTVATVFYCFVRPRIVGLLLFLLFATPVFADGVIAALKNSSTVTRIDASNGGYLGSISTNSAISASSDGSTIAILSASGTVSRYEARSGSFLGSISSDSNATSIQVINGVIAVISHGTVNRYNAKTGNFLGSSSL